MPFVNFTLSLKSSVSGYPNATISSPISGPSFLIDKIVLIKTLIKPKSLTRSVAIIFKILSFHL